MKKYIFLSCFCLTIAIVQYKTGIATREKIREVSNVTQSLISESSKSNVLAAEWAYMNRSERLEKLAEKHLNLKTIEPKQIVGYDDNLHLASLGLDYQLALVSPTKKPTKRS